MKTYIVTWEANDGSRGGMTRHGYSVNDVMAGLYGRSLDSFPKGVPVREFTKLIVKEMTQ